MPRYFQNMPTVGKAVRANPENVAELKAIEEDIHAQIVKGLENGKADADMNAKGQLTAMQRVSLLVDPGTWCPLNSLYNPEKNKTGTTSIVKGLGRVNGKWCVIIASDNKKHAGTWVPGQADNLLRGSDTAKRLRIPLIYLLECAGVELDKQEAVPTADLQKLYEEICGSFIDHHMLVQLRNVKAGPEETEQLFYVQPGAMEVKKREDYQEYIPREGFQVYRDKLKKEGRITHDREFVDNNPNPDLDHMFTYVIDNDILYLRFSNFSIIAQLGNHNKSGEEVAQAAAAAVYREYANQLLFNPNIKGVIIDVRSNGGGYLWDMFTVLGPLLKEDIHVFDTRTKMGVGRLDYGEWVPFRAQVITQRKLGELLEPDCIGDRQVVVLTDSWSVSMSEMTAEPVKKLPYATVIGTRTFGGHGPLTSETHFSFSGQFGDPDCASVSYYVYTSTSMSRTSEGEILEGKGITPDITVPLDVEQFTGQHIDNQLEYAIDFLHGKK